MHIHTLRQPWLQLQLKSICNGLSGTVCACVRARMCVCVSVRAFVIYLMCARFMYLISETDCILACYLCKAVTKNLIPFALCTHWDNRRHTHLPATQGQNKEDEISVCWVVYTCARVCVSVMTSLLQPSTLSLIDGERVVMVDCCELSARQLGSWTLPLCVSARVCVHVCVCHAARVKW